MENQNTILNDEAKVSQQKYCKYCGGKIVPEKEYCEKCGKSSMVEEQKHCIYCGEILQKSQKYCMNCGKKTKRIILPKELDSFNNPVVWKKRGKMIGLSIIAILIIVLLGKPLISTLLVSSEDYLNQGDYVKAYKKAKNKEEVLVENLVAVLCAEAKDNLKDSESFRLKEAYYDKNDSEFVFKIQGTNSYGGRVSSYWYYTFSEEDNEFQLWTTVSDFEQEETHSWEDYDEKLEKLINNAAKKNIQSIIEIDENQLSSDLVNRINQLSVQAILENVIMLEETKVLYPNEENEV